MTAVGGPSRRSALGLLGLASIAAGSQRTARRGTSRSAAAAGLSATIGQITGQPQFQGAQWGMEFPRLGSAKPVYSMSGDQVFVPASAAKVFTAGTVFSTVGPGYRFRTVFGGCRDGHRRSLTSLVFRRAPRRILARFV
jgi:serine-type D-Ala-D-Ala carboxypeptidase/endopeptidase (penicillin-binding protein 4)